MSGILVVVAEQIVVETGEATATGVGFTVIIELTGNPTHEFNVGVIV